MKNINFYEGNKIRDKQTQDVKTISKILKNKDLIIFSDGSEMGIVDCMVETYDVPIKRYEVIGCSLDNEEKIKC